MKKITSPQNDTIKHLVKLRNDRAYREGVGTVLVSGNKMVKELSLHTTPLRILCREGFLYTPKEGVDCILVTDEILKKVTKLTNPEPLAAEFPLPKPTRLTNRKKIVACDQISDPGNLGTLVRSALAFNFDAIFLLDQGVDLFNDKVLRASRGASFLLPFCQGTLDDLIALINENALTLYVADLSGVDISTIKIEKNCVLLLGNESRGPQEQIKKMGKKIKIPISSEVESLNVACAGSILMYALSI